jgi:hypothetical protein
MTARRSVRWSIVVCGLLCVVALIYPSDLWASIVRPVEFLSPVEGEYYKSIDIMTISFLLYSCNPDVDELRPIYFYLYRLLDNDFSYYTEISEYGNIADVIAVDWQWDASCQCYVARIDEAFRVPRSDNFTAYNADCKAAVTFDVPVDQMGPYFHTDGWFTVEFTLKRTPPEKIPVIDPGESSPRKELDGSDDHMVSAPYPNPFNPNTTI